MTWDFGGFGQEPPVLDLGLVGVPQTSLKATRQPRRNKPEVMTLCVVPLR
jgi:hypothetical protein